MNLDLTALLVILVAIALALGAGWWMGRVVSSSRWWVNDTATARFV